MEEDTNKGKKEQDLTWKQTLVLYMHDLAIYVPIILLTFLLLFRIIVVNGHSMNATLRDGDYILLLGNMLCPELKQGDIVVVSKKTYDNGAPLVKRVIATEGQIVDIDFENGIVYVDGLPLEEDYVNTPTNLYEGMGFPLIVDKDCYFVMGDNRNNSRDSRSPDIGQVDRREILGKALFLFFPGTDGGVFPREFSRIGAIHK